MRAEALAGFTGSEVTAMAEAIMVEVELDDRRDARVADFTRGQAAFLRACWWEWYRTGENWAVYARTADVIERLQAYQSQ